MSSWFWPSITTLMKNLVDWVKMTPQEKDEILGRTLRGAVAGGWALVSPEGWSGARVGIRMLRGGGESLN